MHRFIRSFTVVGSIAFLMIVTSGAAQATSYRQQAKLDPPGIIIHLPLDTGQCDRAPGDPELGCFYVDVGEGLDEVATIHDALIDGKVMGVHWATASDGGLCYNYGDKIGDYLPNYCSELPDIPEGTSITWRIGVCTRTLGQDCRGPDWNWSAAHTDRA